MIDGKGGNREVDEVWTDETSMHVAQTSAAECRSAGTALGVEISDPNFRTILSSYPL